MKRKIALARRLRRNQTGAEKQLWWRIRNRQICGCKFRRQVPVDKYIVDFLCEDAKLIIEIDGGQHADQDKYDETRTMALNNYGYMVLRYWNNEVTENIEGVLENIKENLKR